MKTGILQTMKVLKSPGNFISFAKAAVSVALDRLQLVRDPGPEAASWRHATLSAFAPSPSLSAHGAAIVRVMTEKLFNGDWRNEETFQHHCAGCCPDEEVVREKIRRWLPVLLKALRARLLNQGDWLNWQTSLFFVGFLSRMHGLFSRAFAAAFSTAAAPLLQVMSVQDDGHEDLGVTVRKAVRFWTSSEAAAQVFIFRTALLPQHMLMRKIIDNSENRWDALQCTAQMRGQRAPLSDKREELQKIAVGGNFPMRHFANSRLLKLLAFRGLANQMIFCFTQVKTSHTPAVLMV
eukprot:6490560-Amphidinium_carterae.1